MKSLLLAAAAILAAVVAKAANPASRPLVTDQWAVGYAPIMLTPGRPARGEGDSTLFPGDQVRVEPGTLRTLGGTQWIRVQTIGAATSATGWMKLSDLTQNGQDPRIAENQRQSGNPDYSKISGERQQFIAAAKGMTGVMYKWGGADRSGVDCSGLVVYANRITIKKKISRTSDAQAKETNHSAGFKDKTLPGDLAFTAKGGKVTHVMICLEPKCPKVIHAPSKGKTVSEQATPGNATFGDFIENRSKNGR